MKYGKFIEVVGKDLVKSFNFVGKAISNDEARYHMNVALCSDGKLISTDGRRLYILNKWVEDFGFEDGKVYKHLKGTTKISWWAEVTSIEASQFPKWERVIPTEDSVTSTIEYCSEPKNRNGYSFNVSNLLRHTPEGNAINLSYLDGLFDYETWKVKFRGQGKAIIFESKYCMAVIMPMNED